MRKKWIGVLFVLLTAGLAACATPVILAGKVATFALKTGVSLAWNVAKGIGKIGTKEAVHAIDLTADATLKMLAQTEAPQLVEKFWLAVQNGSPNAAYQLLSNTLQRKFNKKEFISYINPWAGHIAAYDLMTSSIRQFHVEIPTRLYMKDQATGAEVGVTVYVSNVDNRWVITGWEADKPR